MRLLIGCVLAGLLVAGVGLAGAGAPADSNAGFGTAVSIDPSATGGFLLKAQISDLSTGGVLAGPALRIPAGETINTQTSLNDGTETIDLTGSVDGAAKVATYTIVIKRGAKTLAEHTAKVAL